MAGQRLLAAGDLEAAAVIFEAMLADRPAGIGRQLLAWTRMRQERLQDAIDLLAVDRHSSAKIELARLHALRGEVTRAAELAAEANRAAMRERGTNRKSAKAQLLLIDVLIHCRSGELEAARALVIREWHRFEAADGGGGWRAEARLVRGFLDAVAGDGVEVWLGLDDASRARVRWMGAEWPELRAFLDAHDPT